VHLPDNGNSEPKAKSEAATRETLQGGSAEGMGEYEHPQSCRIGYASADIERTAALAVK
jgi:hypothetical protein